MIEDVTRGPRAFQEQGTWRATGRHDRAAQGKGQGDSDALGLDTVVYASPVWGGVSAPMVA